MSFKDELLKANLINKKQLKKAEHKKRVNRKELGKEGLAQENAKKEQERQAQKKVQKERDIKLNKEKQSKNLKKELFITIQQGKHYPGQKGRRKFYFIALDGKIPHMLVDESVGERLEKGKAGILEYSFEGQEFLIVDNKTIDKVCTLNKEIILFYND